MARTAEKLPVAFASVCSARPAVAREDADPRASDMQQRAWRDSWSAAACSDSLVVQKKETARLLGTTVVGESARA